MLQLIAVTGLLTGLINAREIPLNSLAPPAQSPQTVVHYSQDTLPSSVREVVSQLPPYQRFATDDDAVMHGPPRRKTRKDSSTVNRTVHHPQPAIPRAGEQHEALPVRLEGHEAVYKTLSN